MSPDFDKYRPYIKGHGLNREAEDKALAALWHVLNTLVDREIALLEAGYPQETNTSQDMVEAQDTPTALSLTNHTNNTEAP